MEATDHWDLWLRLLFRLLFGSGLSGLVALPLLGLLLLPKALLLFFSKLHHFCFLGHDWLILDGRRRDVVGFSSSDFALLLLALAGNLYSFDLVVAVRSPLGLLR